MKTEIIEGNKMIAEFMGIETKNREWDEKLVYLYDNYWRLLEKLKYHSSWDWLMPVCKKITTLKNFPRPVLNGVESVMPYINNMRKMKHGAIKFDINETFLGVVEFLKWHNQNNNQ